MKHISLLIPVGDISLSNVEGTYHIFSEVNRALTIAGKQPLFNVQLVGLRKNSRVKNDLFSIHPEVLIQDVSKTDLIIIPALHTDVKKGVEKNQELVPWIVQQYKNGAEVASLCTGAFLLASTGLLKGKNCATHWLHLNDFRIMYPDVNLVDDKVMTAEAGIYTSGAAYSYLNLILYLVEKYADREMAILSSKIFAIEIERETQSPFIIFTGQKEHSDDQIKKIQEFIEVNYQEKITVDRLATMFALSRRNLERRFKKATANTVVEYTQRVKVEAAKKNLETARKNINEVMYEVGYSDNKAFRTTFKKFTGLSPIQYRNKYNRELAA